MDVKLEPVPIRGFRFAGVAAGLKTVLGAKDLGLVAADRPAPAAGFFTSNRVKAAPVVIASQRIKSGKLQAIVANSGSANCFTGAAGLKLARDSCSAVASAIGCAPELVAPCSTGVIGRTYDLEKFRAGVSQAIASLSANGLEEFSRAIMTTDTRPKMASTTITFGGKEIRVAGAAKGAGMISPNMATLLAFIMTDAAGPVAMLKSAIKHAMPRSFNAITVDGDMSTNDTLIIMASGAAENRAPSSKERTAFDEAVAAIAASLARQLVHDAEGATKLVSVEVRGARSASQADRVARRIANSPLVKTAFFGCDPNVGRIIAAAGACDNAIDPDKLELWVGGSRIASKGAIINEALQAAAREMHSREFVVRLDLKLGKGVATILTSDLSLDYVRINAEYTT